MASSDVKHIPTNTRDNGRGHQRKAPLEPQKELSPNLQMGQERSPHATNNVATTTEVPPTTQRKRKKTAARRFLWQEDQHLSFVAAIFDREWMDRGEGQCCLETNNARPCLRAVSFYNNWAQERIPQSSSVHTFNRKP